jgi:hypothetical protein
MNTKSAWQHFSELPEEAQRQVIEFIEFLKSRSASQRRQSTTKRTKLANDAFVGMWRNRTDMRDSNAWVRNLRKEDWTNQ